MDSILLLSSEEQKLEKFLVKMGYDVYLPSNQIPIKEIVGQRVLDLILIDNSIETDAVELCDFLRNNDATKHVPILCLNKDKVKGYKIRDLALEKIEIIPAPYTIGSLVAKVATQLRLRKMAGKDSMTASLAESNASLRDLNARFRQEREQARSIQVGLLPEKLPESNLFDIAIAYKPLEEVGGDWYFISQPSDGLLSIQIADVTGHGLAAAFVGCMTKLALTAANSIQPEVLLKETNRLISPNLPQGNFITICSCLYNQASGAIEYASGGHPPGILFSSEEKKSAVLKGSGFALGFFEDSEYTKVSAVLKVNDIFIMYTDGITEAQNRSGQQYGTERLSAVLSGATAEMTADQIKDLIFKDFHAFCDGRILKDDITLLVLKKTA